MSSFYLFGLPAILYRYWAWLAAANANDLFRHTFMLCGFEELYWPNEDLGYISWYSSLFPFGGYKEM